MSAQVKPAILVVSFGTSFHETRMLTIGSIENVIREQFPEYDVFRAFTAQKIINKLRQRDNLVIFNVEEALQDLIARGVTDLVVQPTHLMDGHEFHDLENMLNQYRDRFESVRLGAPLLSSDDDFSLVIEALKESFALYEADDTAIVLMGHGTDAASNAVYGKMQGMLNDMGMTSYFVTTVEAEPDFAQTVEEVKAAGFKKAVLRPLMVVAGDHATNDMADEEDPESLAGLCLAAGIEPTSIIEGLGQMYSICLIYKKHVDDALAGVTQ